MRYHVRNQKGEEMVVPSLADLHGLYSQGFLEDEDYVRADNAERWVKVGNFPALGGVRHRRREPARFQMLLLAAIAIVAVIGGAYRSPGVLLLILLVTLASFFWWSRRGR
jgi:Flp pilus assembly protein TadB